MSPRHALTAAALAALLAAPALSQTGTPTPEATPTAAAATPEASPEATPTASPAAEAAPGQDAEGPADASATPASDAAPVAGTYDFDPQHSQIVYSYDHMGMSTSTGMVRGVTGQITLDPAAPAEATVTASFPLSALMTVSADLDKHMMGDDFFKGAPADTAITFASTAVEPSGTDAATVTGDLTLNGVTRPVTLAVTLNGAGVSPMTQKPVVGFAATATLKRSDFNLGAFAPAVSDEVAVTIAVEAQKP